ncbi:MAG TPA: hypothetical protein VLD40_05555, partial [Dissulfurispiraceae bacterium]|nr:hypothetical protein [Dissulfurispiraceae bacterium]
LRTQKAMITFILPSQSPPLTRKRERSQVFTVSVSHIGGSADCHRGQFEMTDRTSIEIEKRHVSA